MLVIDGPAGNGIGKSIASRLGYEFTECRYKVFPDGESEVCIEENVRGKDVAIVQSTHPFQDKRIIELLLLSNEAKQQGANSICAIVPYLAYARQDKRIQGKGNAVSISTILELLSFAGISKLVTVQPHKIEALADFRGNVKVIDAITPLANEVKKSVSEPFILAPDKGALGIAKRFADVLGCGYTNIDKQRDRITGEVKIIKAPQTDFEGKEVIVVDDMISTGGTIALSSDFAYSNGASKVIAASVHLIMAGNAQQKIVESGVKEIYGTNTIPYEKAHIVDISSSISIAIEM